MYLAEIVIEKFIRSLDKGNLELLESFSEEDEILNCAFDMYNKRYGKLPSGVILHVLRRELSALIKPEPQKTNP
jgi:hypothetical protein